MSLIEEVVELWDEGKHQEVDDDSKLRVISEKKEVMDTFNDKNDQDFFNKPTYRQMRDHYEE